MKQNNKVFIAAVLIVAVLFSFIPLTGGFGNVKIKGIAGTTDSANPEPYTDPANPISTIISTGSCGRDLTWELSSDGTLTIHGTGDMWDDCQPGGRSIRYIIFDGEITGIGWCAFSYSELISIEIPESVTHIEDCAFASCKKLISVKIPNSITSIGCSIFSGCTGLTEIEIPDSVTTIGNSAFSGCTGLTEIEVPDSVTSIGDSAFSGCTGLERITLNNSDCGLYMNPDVIPTNTVIYGKHDSTALKYAEIFGRDFVFIDEHTYTEGFTLPATCAAYGYKTLVCSCGDTKNELIEPVGHKDENEDGKCDFCKMNMTAVCDHDFALDYTPATCTADGEIRMTCTLCKKTSTKVIPATGHNYVDFVIEPTCTSDGYTKHYCINCGDELRDTPVKALGHAMRTQTITPTCTEQGCDIVICDNCGYNYEANVVAAAGHKAMLVNAIEADKYSDGYTGDVICSVCNALLEAGEVIPAQSEGGEDTPQVKCSHLCHKSGILGFFWKLINFFNKLFKINQFCECGAAHW